MPVSRSARRTARRAAAFVLLPLSLAGAPAAHADDALAAAVAAIEPKVVAWRRDIHQHPELGNREFRTAKLVAEHLKGSGSTWTPASRTPASSPRWWAASPAR